MIISEEVKIDIAAWVVSLEDKRFFKHSGIDHLATIRAITMYALGRAHGGASTIEMQLWRTITGRKERTIVRKITEAKAARQISKRMDKLDTLEIYCDIAFASTSHYSMRSTLRSAAKAQGGSLCGTPARRGAVSQLQKKFIDSSNNPKWRTSPSGRQTLIHATLRVLACRHGSTRDLLRPDVPGGEP